MEPLRVARSEDDVFGPAPIRVVLGGREKLLPPLSVAANREWKKKIATATGAGWTAYASADESDKVTGLLTGLSDEMLNLLLAYDVGGSLGGREWIEHHASDPEIYAAFKEVACVAYPPFRDVRDVPGLLQAVIGLIASVSRARMSSSPGIGESFPAESTPS